MNWHILLAVLVGLVIFMHGIENFSHEMISFAGERFRKLLRKATRNRFTGGLAGTLVTALIQSSTATTVITISLVSAGAISFAQSLGVIFGANVGSTITAQLVALKVTAFAPHFVILGFIISLLHRPYKYIGRGIFYIGLVFFGLNLVQEAITPIKDSPQIIALFSNLTNPYFALLIGLVFTAIAHSSSITTGLVVVLASSGILTLTQGIMILLGSNIGTTITAATASLKLSLHAKRGAAAHSLFNILGVLLILPFIRPFTQLIEWMGGNGAQQVANAHTIFNITTAILFLILLKPVEKLINWLIRGEEKEVLISTQYLNEKLPESNRQALSLIEKEIAYSLQTVYDFYELATQVVVNGKEVRASAIDKYEALADLLDERIEAALLELSRRPLSEKEARKIVLLVRISNLTEQLADTAKNLGRLLHSRTIAATSLSPEALESIQKIYSRLQEPFAILKREFPKSLPEFPKLSRHLSAVSPAIARGYSQHIKRLQKRQAIGGSIFVESSSLLDDGAGKLKEIMKLCQQYARLRSV
ncbi:Na/Pi cotransporter family protein [Candidatus Peregrinibacteria bacterium]|nr:Na/Pi cotransporter family protein [Candidatus Peregrinibacteria bacterium]